VSQVDACGDDEQVDRTTGADTGAPRGGPPVLGSGSELPGPGRVVLVLVLMAVAVVAGGLAGPWDPPLSEDREEPSLQAPTAPPSPLLPDLGPIGEPTEAMEAERWDLSWLAAGLAVLVGAGVVYLLLRWLQRRPGRRVEEPPDPGDVAPRATIAGGEPQPDLPALREGLRGAHAHLQTRVRPADAVLAAWVALETAAEQSGIARHPASTPTEFTVAVLDRTRADRAATRTLLTLYLRARFSDEPISRDDVTAATAAVRRLTADLAREPDPVPDEDADADGNGNGSDSGDRGADAGPQAGAGPAGGP
jgi:hypothetical protein